MESLQKVPIILHLAKRPKQPWLVIQCPPAICIGYMINLLNFPLSRNERSPILAEIMCYCKILPFNHMWSRIQKKCIFLSSSIFEVESSFKQNMWMASQKAVPSLKDVEFKTHTHLSLHKSKCRTGCWIFF